ncbi:MAG: sugar ABC transporter substrate-binding protein [Deltaproteobacteria bacterium]|nr:sugar ABC transporter substrate-binding protein [Deltaproteobacteria bacterium]
MRSRKILLVILCLTATILWAVGANGQDIKLPAGKKFTIGWSNASLGNPWRIAMVDMVKEEAKKYPSVNLLITNAEDKAAKQISDSEDLLAKGVDLLMLSPTTLHGVNPVVDKAVEKKVPLVVVQRETSNKNYTALVWNDDVALGTSAFVEMARILGMEGKVAVIEGIAGASSSLGRTQGIKSAAANYPNIKLVALQPGDYQEAKAITAMENIIQANPDLNGLISHSGTMARGALKALKNAGKAGKVIVVSIGSENHVLKEIKRGNMHSTVMEPTRVGVEGFRVGLRLLAGEKLPKLNPTYAPVVNSYNIDQWVKMDGPDDTWVW